jgi:hypothetical protein
MKKLICLSLVCLLGATIAFAGPKITKGIWSSDNGEIKTNYWNEAFIANGQPGQIGNIVSAQGTGFQISNLAIADHPVCSLVLDDPAKPYLACTTPYSGGSLFLNAGGPWMKSGNVTLTGVTATNHSKTYLAPDLSQPTGELEFTLHILHGFTVGADNYTIDVAVTWEGFPVMQVLQNGVVFQRGTNFGCIASIN